MVVVTGHLIVPQLSGGALAWLVGGGLAYLLGALIYSRQWPDPWPGRFGHHEIWHLFVLVGAGAHYAFTWSLVGSLLPAVLSKRSAQRAAGERVTGRARSERREQSTSRRSAQRGRHRHRRPC